MSCSRLRDRLERGRELSIEVVELVATLDFPDQEMSYELVSVDHPTSTRCWASGSCPTGASTSAWPSSSTTSRSTTSNTRPRCTHASSSEASTSSVRWPATPFSADKLSPAAADAARAAGLGPTCRNPFRSIVVRAVEVVHAFDTAIALIDRYEQPDAPVGSRSKPERVSATA